METFFFRIYRSPGVCKIQRYLTINVYLFYEVANLYNLTPMILYGFCKW